LAKAVDDEVADAALELNLIPGALDLRQSADAVAAGAILVQVAVTAAVPYALAVCSIEACLLARRECVPVAAQGRRVGRAPNGCKESLACVSCDTQSPDEVFGSLYSFPYLKKKRFCITFWHIFM